MLALPCCRRGGILDWDGDAAGGASATGSEGGEAPSAAPPAACGGGAGARAACPPPSWWPWVEAAIAPAEGTAAAAVRSC